MAPQRSNYHTRCRPLREHGRVDGVWRWSPSLLLCLSDTALGLWALSSLKGTESQKAPYGSTFTREMNHHCHVPSDGRSTGEILKLLCFSLSCLINYMWFFISNATDCLSNTLIDMISLPICHNFMLNLPLRVWWNIFDIEIFAAQ